MSNIYFWRIKQFTWTSLTGCSTPCKRSCFSHTTNTGIIFVNTLVCLPAIASMTLSMNRCNKYACFLGFHRWQANKDNSSWKTFSQLSARLPDEWNKRTLWMWMSSVWHTVITGFIQDFSVMEVWLFNSPQFSSGLPSPGLNQVYCSHKKAPCQVTHPWANARGSSFPEWSSQVHLFEWSPRLCLLPGYQTLLPKRP